MQLIALKLPTRGPQHVLRNDLISSTHTQQTVFLFPIHEGQDRDRILYGFLVFLLIC